LFEHRSGPSLVYIIHYFARRQLGFSGTESSARKDAVSCVRLRLQLSTRDSVLSTLYAPRSMSDHYLMQSLNRHFALPESADEFVLNC
jgi:hypothetical protein